MKIRAIGSGMTNNTSVPCLSEGNLIEAENSQVNVQKYASRVPRHRGPLFHLMCLHSDIVLQLAAHSIKMSVSSYRQPLPPSTQQAEWLIT
jgi:hypothetical protein